MDLRTEICLEMEKVGIEVEVSHHEVATAGQGEIDMQYDSLLKCADKLMWFKSIVKNVSYRNGKTATFMPKPMFGDNGNGMHCHQSLWKDGKPLFAGDGYAGLSELALYYIGGILKHSHALAALDQPDDQHSYRRLVPGYESAGQFGLFEPQSLGRHPYFYVLAVSEITTSRAAFSGPLDQSLPGLQRHDDGRARRHSKQDRSGRSPRQGHLLVVGGGAERRAAHAGVARAVARRARGGS